MPTANIEANKVVTSYDRRALANDIVQAAIDGRLLHLDKKRSQPILAGVSVAIPQRAIQGVDFKKNIQDFWANVKWEKAGKKKLSFGESTSVKTEIARAFDEAQQKQKIQKNSAAGDGAKFKGEYSLDASADGEALQMLCNIGIIKEEAHPKIKGSRANNDDGPRGFAPSAHSIHEEAGKSQGAADLF